MGASNSAARVLAAAALIARAKEQPSEPTYVTLTLQSPEIIVNAREEKLVERRVTYTLEHGGRFYVVENVPAGVNEETGEQCFSLATVERLQRTILEQEKPSRVIETPVYEYAE